MDQKPVVHLHDGILCSTKKEGASTLCDSMNELESTMLSEISQLVKDKDHDFTYKWNLINKRIKQNITRDIEIKNKLTVTRREVGEG